MRTDSCDSTTDSGRASGPSSAVSDGGVAAWALVRSRAVAHGLSLVGATPAAAVAQHALYSAWLAAELHGELHYLTRPDDREARRDPRALLAEARTVVCFAVSYYHPDPDESASPSDLRGQIARYARAEDYHLVLKRRLGALAVELGEALGRPLLYRACVDSAPLLERALAAGAGLGFQGKNTLLITPGLGSYTVLGELLLDLELPTGTAMASRCGECRRCLDICPTGALVDEYRVDARRCISALTIENSGAIPRELRRAVGTWIFGCDLCQEVCPWNAAARPGDPELRPRRGHARPELLALLALGAAQFRRFVKRTALRRLGRTQLLRNVAVALGNVATAAELPALLTALEKEPALVRQHLLWALEQIALRDGAVRPQVVPVLRSHARGDADAAVCEEALRALATLGEAAEA